jgi:hypothetical protein
VKTPRNKSTDTGNDATADRAADTETCTDRDTDTDKDKDEGETSVYPGSVFAPQLELVQSPWPEARYLESHARLGFGRRHFDCCWLVLQNICGFGFRDWGWGWLDQIMSSNWTVGKNSATQRPKRQKSPKH